MLLLPGMSSCYPLVGQKEMKMLKGERRSGWSFYNEHSPAARASMAEYILYTLTINR